MQKKTISIRSSSPFSFASLNSNERPQRKTPPVIFKNNSEEIKNPNELFKKLPFLKKLALKIKLDTKVIDYDNQSLGVYLATKHPKEFTQLLQQKFTKGDKEIYDILNFINSKGNSIAHILSKNNPELLFNLLPNTISEDQFKALLKTTNSRNKSLLSRLVKKASYNKWKKFIKKNSDFFCNELAKFKETEGYRSPKELIVRLCKKHPSTMLATKLNLSSRLGYTIAHQLAAHDPQLFFKTFRYSNTKLLEIFRTPTHDALKETTLFTLARYNPEEFLDLLEDNPKQFVNFWYMKGNIEFSTIGDYILASTPMNKLDYWISLAERAGIITLNQTTSESSVSYEITCNIQ